jgi:hypothetical protein
VKRRGAALMTVKNIAETFLAAFAKRDRYDLGHADARPWLYGIATNLVGQHRRDEARQYRIRQAAAAEPEVPGHAERVAADVTAEAMRALLTWLSGLGAVWLLWRPASSAFFKSARAARSRPPSQIQALNSNYEVTMYQPLPVQRPAGRAADPALFPEYLAIPQDNAGLPCRLPGRGYRTSSKAPRTIASNPDRADGDGAAAGSLSIATTTKVWPLLLVAR